MSKTLPPNYAELCKLLYDAATLGAVASLLNWDQETYMPAAGSGNRSDQQSMLAELVHAPSDLGAGGGVDRGVRAGRGGDGGRGASGERARDAA